MSEPQSRLRLYVTPRSAHDEIVDCAGGVLRIRVKAPPVDGKANAAVERLLAGALKLPAAAVSITAGHGGRHKLVTVTGLSQPELQARLESISRRQLPFQ